LEAVVLGVIGVLQSREALRRAQVEAAVAHLRSSGFAPESFPTPALGQLEDGNRPLRVSRALRATGVILPAAIERQVVRAAANAYPRTVLAPEHRQALKQLRVRFRLALLDDGEGARMDPWVRSLGLDSLFERQLWTSDLCRQARSPSPYPFRWLADRFGLRPKECMYVSGAQGLRRAATAAGWRVIEETHSGNVETIDLNALADRLDALDAQRLE
jgi:FMN phosphatase YigB (HAD superfamily)